jgi:hypothetical protein
MKVLIENFNVEMEVKNGYIWFLVYDNRGGFLGSLHLNKTRLVWCDGRTQVKNGIQLDWQDFIDMAHEHAD